LLQPEEKIVGVFIELLAERNVVQHNRETYRDKRQNGDDEKAAIFFAP
jgi:hypothetical protein